MRARPVTLESLTIAVPEVRPYASPSTPAPSKRALQKRRERERQNGVEESAPSVPDAPDEIPEDAVALTDDLAATVVKKTLKGIASGALQPSLRDGLIAQQLLDRRAEKVADRQFMLALTQALAGGGAAAPQAMLPARVEPPEDVVEGYFEDISLAPAHLRAE